MASQLKERARLLFKNNIGGISTAKFDRYSGNVTIAGWFLSKEKVDKVLVYYGDHIVLGKAKLNQPRPDVSQKYPGTANATPGFVLETRFPIDFSRGLPIIIRIFSNNREIQAYQTQLAIDNTVGVELEKLLDNNNVYFNYIPSRDTNTILDKVHEINLELKEFTVDFNDYQQWMDTINYEKNYPKYAAEFGVDRYLPAKSLQHYLSLRLLGIDKKAVYLDVASSKSVFPDILTGNYKVKKVFRQDLLYKKGIHGSHIGSNAVSIPLPGESIDKITLHCSWEHFEYDSDRAFIKEAHRILKKGGGLCIIPLYLAEEYFLITSPAVWLHKYAKVTMKPPQFEKGMTICIDDEIKQRQAKYYDPQNLVEIVLQPFFHYFHMDMIHFINHKDHTGCPVFALYAVKK